MRVAVTTAAVLLVSLPALAQDEAARRAATEVAARVPFEKTIKGAPYTAETLIEGTQALADGNRIHRKTTGRVYRDGEGRSRREEDRPNGTTSISIVDPIGGFSYSLDTQNKIAWRTPVGVGGAIMGKIEAAQQPAVVTRRVEPVRTTNPDGSVTLSNKVEFVETTRAEAEKMEAEKRARVAGAQDAQSKAAAVEQARTAAEYEKEKVEVRAAGGGGRGGARGGGGGFGGAVVAPTMRGGRGGETTPLEHKVLDGLSVEGRKTTTVIPAGQIGNEQPITITSEEWRSPDLNVLVMTRHADPRSGESIYRLTNVIRAEPDPSLFMVPPDYTVKDTGIRKMLEASIRK